MSSDLSLRWMAAVDSMPPFPRSVQKVLALARDAESSPKELVLAINQDPVLTFKVLRVVNSAHYGLANQVTSIDHAVVFLGSNLIKNLALAIASHDLLPKMPLQGLDLQRFLLHSLTCAALARRIAEWLPQADPYDCFIAGLLHDFGKLVLAQALPQEFEKALEMSLWDDLAMHLALRRVLAVDHAEVAALLCEKWHFPQPLVDVIRHQHQPEQCDTQMMACVVGANRVCQHLGLDLTASGALEPLLPASVQRHLGADLAALLARLGDLNALLAEAELAARI